MNRIKHTLGSFIVLMIMSGGLLLSTGSESNKACAQGSALSCGAYCQDINCEGGPDPCHRITCSDGTVINCGMGGFIP